MGVGFGVGVGVSVGLTVGAWEGDAVGCARGVGDALKFGEGMGFGAACLVVFALLQTSFAPFFTHLNCEPLTLFT